MPPPFFGPFSREKVPALSFARQKELLNAFHASLGEANNPRKKAYKEQLEKRFPN